ncbi:MAG: hypothetical protein WCK95_26675, partial [Alphaproteobacteria bacterium]
VDRNDLCLCTVRNGARRHLPDVPDPGARAGGANIWRATIRVTFWGALAMALTAGIGRLFGTVV